jgi:hypothetical protein
MNHVRLEEQGPSGRLRQLLVNAWSAAGFSGLRRTAEWMTAAPEFRSVVVTIADDRASDAGTDLDGFPESSLMLGRRRTVWPRQRSRFRFMSLLQTIDARNGCQLLLEERRHRFVHRVTERDRS